MRRTYRQVEPQGVVVCTTESGELIEVPVFAGILKHPDSEQLRELLTDPVVVRKYTCEALRKAPWSALRRFPRAWLIDCMPHARLRSGRRRAFQFLLGLE